MGEQRGYMEVLGMTEFSRLFKGYEIRQCGMLFGVYRDGNCVEMGFQSSQAAEDWIVQRKIAEAVKKS